MKSKIAFTALALPLVLGGYFAFHPGIAYAEPSFAGSTPTALQTSGTYTVDPAHTSIGFEVRHMGIADVQGRFNKKTGKLVVDTKDITRSTVEFTIETASIDTGVEARDNHLRSPDFFEASKYPEMRFKSTRIRKQGSGYVADGQLTIKGTTKNVSLPFKHYGPISDARAGSRIGVIVEPFVINRQDYGIAYNQKLGDGTPSVGDNVTVRAALEATLDKAGN